MANSVRPPFRADVGMHQQSHSRHGSVANAPGTAVRSRSNTSASSKSQQRPKSRGSTTSVQSAVTTQTQHCHHDQPAGHRQAHQHDIYIAHAHPEERQPPYQHDPEQVLQMYGQQMAQTQHYHHIDPNLAEAHYEMRPDSQQGLADHEPQHYPMQGMPHYGMPHEHLRSLQAPAESLDGLENQSPAPEDSETAEPGGKRKKGNASSLANDAELRRLVKQYHGRTLKDVAAEVQRNEGGGGKSEKAKQVFAMLWLQESCRRSTNSVRRDKVFSHYTERCGNERVPILNAASFGKLVRIIFPNVQTRRLGVRGESKYHYVDLSLSPNDDDRQTQTSNQNALLAMDGHGDHRPSIETANMAHQSHIHAASVPQQMLRQVSADTAEFPAPRASFSPKPTPQAQLSNQPGVSDRPTPAPKMDCHHMNTPIIRIPTGNMSAALISALPALRANLPGTISAYVAMPSSKSSAFPLSQTEASPMELPDIHAYLSGTTYDSSTADSLANLYRSYCIVVIDALRYCKEKQFFHHHTAFNGTMTVPVSKLFGHERLIPWIKECDMRMYKKMIEYISPLVTQVVPVQVWGIFERVSNKLVSHLLVALEEKVPTHVLVAKIVPAARFCHLLRKLRGANAAANHVATMLGNESQRTQMWVDFVACVDPERVVEESLSPPECVGAIEGTLRYDIRGLLKPTSEDSLVNGVEQDPRNPFVAFMASAGSGAGSSAGVLEQIDGFPSLETAGPLDLWIRWLETISATFAGHHPQCLINWHNGFWKSVVSQVGMGGAPSYQAWWYLEAFLSAMLSWITSRQGLLLDGRRQREMDEDDRVKRQQDESREPQERLFTHEHNENGVSRKRKRPSADVGGMERSVSRASNTSTTSSGEAEGPIPRPHTAVSHTGGLDGAANDDLEELEHGGPLVLPCINVGSSPQKRQHQTHDDSGISLDIEIEDEFNRVEVDGQYIEGAVGDSLKGFKRMKKDWGILSDPADETGDVVVI